MRTLTVEPSIFRCEFPMRTLKSIAVKKAVSCKLDTAPQDISAALFIDYEALPYLEEIYIYIYIYGGRTIGMRTIVMRTIGMRTIGMRTIVMRTIGMEDNWHAENWHGGQLAFNFLIVSYLITLMF